MGNILKETCNGHEITSTYDLLGRRTHIGSSLGADISQTFDVLGNVEKISSILLSPTEREGVCGGEEFWSATMDYDRQGLEIQRTLSGGVVAQTKRDRLGRVRFQNAIAHQFTTHLWREYDWNYDHRLASITDHKNHYTTAFEYDDRGFLERAIYNRKEQVWRTADKLGNLYQSKEKNDRQYQSSQLVKTKTATYKYDSEGFLIEKKENNGVWKYYWTAGGMLKAVQRADGKVFTFKYDAFGRRISKKYLRREFLYIWDGNVLLHEIKKDYQVEDQLTTWVFQDFVPVAKLQGGKSYSIISDHIGTPLVAIDNEGVKVWERELDIYGKVRKLQGDKWFMPFLYQGQYYDVETELAYNRFRYYNCNTGSYISQDPIRLAGNNPTLYGYVFDSNIEIDIFGLACANGGNAKKHGGDKHNEAIDNHIKKLKTTEGVQNIRKNQQQVDVNGNKVGNNKPDIQYDLEGVHYNVEYDTTKKGSLKHQKTIPMNDSESVNSYFMIDEKGEIYLVT